MEAKKVKHRNLILSIILVVSIIVGTFSLTYGFAYVPVTGNFTNTAIETGTYTFDITTNIDNATAINASNMQLIDENDIASEAPSVNFTVKTDTYSALGRFNVYLKDISISNNLIDQNGSFKWQLLRGNTIVEQGSFNNIATVGTSDPNNVNTQTTSYYSRYNIKTGLTFDSTNTSSFTFRIYLLNSETVDQTNLTNGTFQAKLAVEGYNIQNNS